MIMVMIIITNDLNGKIAFMSSNTFGKVTVYTMFLFLLLQRKLKRKYNKIYKFERDIFIMHR